MTKIGYLSQPLKIHVATHSIFSRLFLVLCEFSIVATAVAALWKGEIQNQQTLVQNYINEFQIVVKNISARGRIFGQLDLVCHASNMLNVY